MKIYYTSILSILLCLLTIGCNEKQKTSLPIAKKKIILSEEENAYKTKIKSKTSYMQEVKFGELDSIGKIWDYTLYDTLGRKLVEKSYYSSTKLNEKKEYSYDSDGNLVEIKTIDSDGGLDGREVYEYTENQLTEKNVYKYGGFYEKFRYSYNEKNKLIMTNHYDREGERIERIETDYDSLDNIKSVKTITYDLKESKRYEYDSAGNIILFRNSKFSEFDPNTGGYVGENSEEVYSYEYDLKGNLIKEKLFESFADYYANQNGLKASKEPKLEIIRSYDDGGNMIQYENNYWILKFKYDHKNNMVEELVFNKSNEIDQGHRYIYEYYK